MDNNLNFYNEMFFNKKYGKNNSPVLMVTLQSGYIFGLISDDIIVLKKNKLNSNEGYNHLIGNEQDVIKKMTAILNLFQKQESQYFTDMNREVLKNALTFLKRFKGNDTNLEELSKFISNKEYGLQLIDEFSKNKLIKSTHKLNDNKNIMSDIELILWFKESYFNESSKIYEFTDGLRIFIDGFIDKTDFKYHNYITYIEGIINGNIVKQSNIRTIKTEPYKCFLEIDNYIDLDSLRYQSNGDTISTDKINERIISINSSTNVLTINPSSIESIKPIKFNSDIKNFILNGNSRNYNNFSKEYLNKSGVLNLINWGK